MWACLCKIWGRPDVWLLSKVHPHQCTAEVPRTKKFPERTNSEKTYFSKKFRTNPERTNLKFPKTRTNPNEPLLLIQKNQKLFQELMLKLILKLMFIQILNLNTTVRFIRPALTVIRFDKTTMIYCTMMSKY